jgi:hypothetical protein
MKIIITVALCLFMWVRCILSDQKTQIEMTWIRQGAGARPFLYR